MKITVTADDIRLGIKDPTSGTKCPVARAFKRVGIKNINVGVEGAFADGEEILLPKKAVSFIKDMCNEEPLKPFSFMITKKQFATLKGIV